MRPDIKRKKMDEIDRAQHQEQMYRDIAIAAAKRQPKNTISPTGYCHNCGEEVDNPKLFCDGNCASEWEKTNKQKR